MDITNFELSLFSSDGVIELNSHLPWQRPGDGHTWADKQFNYPLYYQWCEIEIGGQKLKRLVKAGAQSIWIPLFNCGIKIFKDVGADIGDDSISALTYLIDQHYLYNYLNLQLDCPVPVSQAIVAIKNHGTFEGQGHIERPLYGLLLNRIYNQIELPSEIVWDRDILNVKQLLSCNVVDPAIVVEADIFVAKMQKICKDAGYVGWRHFKNDFDIHRLNVNYDGNNFFLLDVSRCLKT